MGADAPDLTRINAELADKIASRIEVRGRTLGRAARKAGRELPRWVRRDIAYLQEAELWAGHPKLRAMVDTRRAGRAARRVSAWLDGIDPAERRKDRWLRLLAVIAFNFLLLVAAVIAVLAWRGLIGPGAG